ncbi:hypothetical protein JEQ12_012165 [Ovis aries]|uniref:WD repeat-containing protein 90 n=1 Tax=Ovis aries TaxID=9940 RepID=A0A836CTG9_SHEEP|nr:hypothetical protein JEQ12_012165 [Ovis aries]
MARVWQQPFLNVFRHFKVDEWKRSTKEGDVAAVTDKTLKCTVYRVRGAVSASNYIQLPKTSTQSLGLTGRYLYVLFRPLPAKHFVIHLDVSTEDSQVIRVSFSNLFKEFKSTATWLQFPFICEAGTPREGVAFPGARWTCLQLDLHDILLVYLQRCYSHLKGVRLCASMLVRSLYTSDLCFDPAITVAEARRSKLPVTPIPREMAFPVPKGESWHDRYVHIRFPSGSSHVPSELVQKSGFPPEAGACSKPARDSRARVIQKHDPTASFLPDPILRLKGVIGFGGHSTKWVSALALDGSSSLLASAQARPHSMLRLWDFQTGSCLALFRSPVHTISSLRMASCGRGSVRLWRLRGGALRSCAVDLGEHHTLEFTDLAFGPAQNGHTLYVCSRSGHILEIDHQRMAVRHARRLLPLQTPRGPLAPKRTFSSGPGIAINSLSVSRSACAVGSEDGYLRLWPLDFSSVLLEAEHEGPVSSVRVSPGGLRVLSTTSSGHLGFLDIPSQEYRLLVRSHTAPVLALATERSRGQLATVSQDRTVRVWDLATLQQLYDFTSPEEAPRAVAFHPTQPTFFCGFSSGAVRSFSLEAAEVLVEHRCHRGAITGLAASPDGRFLFSACSRGALAQYHSGAPRCRVLRVAANVVCQEACPSSSILAVSEDSCLLAFVGPSKYTVSIVDTASLDELLRVNVSALDLAGSCLDSAVALCFGPSPPSHLLVSTSSNTIAVLDARSGHVVREVYIGHSEPVRAVAFTPDQQQLLSVGDAIFLWDILVPLSRVLPGPPRPAKQGLSLPPAGDEWLRLKAVVGYNGNGRTNLVWSPDTGFFAYTCGCLVVVEDLHSGAQQHWLGHPEEISTLALSHDAQVLASASGRSGAASRCQIRLWDVPRGSCRQLLSHHDTAVQALAFSLDDRLLITLGDCGDGTLALWSTATCELLSSTRLPEPVHGMAFSPWHTGELACVGQGILTLQLLWGQAGDVSLQAHREPVPEELGGCELSSLCYGAAPLLYCGSNEGQVCVWDTRAGCCFLAWEADEGEIGVLLCSGTWLVSGSNTRRLRLWAVGAVPELRRRGSGARSSSVFLERELTLDGAVVSAVFHDSMDMGVVGTTAGTLWYISWAEGTSTRLISGHRSKVNEVAFSPDESHCATCSDDGSVRVWCVASTELLIQFQVLSQSCLCLAWSPQSCGCPEEQHVAAGYSDGTLRVFSIPRSAVELKMYPHTAALTALAFSADGQTIVSGDKDGLVAVSHLRTGMTFRVLSDHRGAPICTLQSTRKECGDFGAEGTDLWLAASGDQRVSVWASDWLRDHCELVDWLSFPAPSLAEVVEKIPLPFFAVSMSLSPGAHLVAIGFSERMVRLLDCASGTVQDFAGHDDSVQLCRFAPSAQLLFTAAHSEILVWEVTGH